MSQHQIRQRQKNSTKNLRSQIVNTIKEHEYAIRNNLDLTEFGYKKTIHYPHWWEDTKPYSI